jgi:16S rRNA (guanine966-N2)-methyltransferase
MRIVAGTLRGKQFQEMHKHRMHPMGEKIRGALFNILGDIEDLTFLDAFAGSGALSLEAVSRGAKSSVAIEKDRAAHALIDRNVIDLRIDKKVDVVRANTAGWSIHNMEKKFDIVLLDPPFSDMQVNLLHKLVKRHVKAGGLAVLSAPAKFDLPEFEETKVIVQKSYGDAQLVFYHKITKK